jgi:hypothetical protein
MLLGGIAVRSVAAAKIRRLGRDDKAATETAEVIKSRRETLFFRAILAPRFCGNLG